MDNFNFNKDKINKLVNETSPIPSTSRSFFDSSKPSSTTQSSLPAQEALRRKLLFNHPTLGTSRTSYFGGTANSSLTASARARRLSSLTPYSLQSRQTPVHRIEPKRLKKNDGEYQTESDRILKMLEKASTPINDAKKMPIYHSEFDNLLSDLRLLKGNNLKIPKTPRITPTEIIINHKTPPLKWDLTLPLKKDDDKDKVAGDDVKDKDLYGKNVNEGGGKIMASKRQTDKIIEDNDVVVLPKATLEIPQGTTLPKFNFGLNQSAKPSSTTIKPTSITATATATATATEIETETETETISNQLCKKCRNKVSDDDNDDKQENIDDNCDSRFSFSLPNIKVRKRKTESSQTISNNSKKLKINQSQNSNSEKLLTSTETSSSKVSNQNFLVPNILMTDKSQNQKIFFGQSENKVETSSSLSKSNSTLSSSTSNWGDKFKLTSDKWSCPCCMLYNENSLSNCPSCNEPNPNKSKVEAPKIEEQKKNETIKQVPKPIAKPLVKENDKSSSQMKWRCDTCLVTNEPCDRKCIACDTIRLSNEKIVDNTNYKFDFSNLEQKNSIFKTNLSSSALTTAPSTQSTVTSSSFFQLPTAATTTASSSTSTFASLFQSSPATTTSQSQAPATTPSTFTFGSPSTTTSSLFHSQTASPATTTTSLFQSQVPTTTTSSSSFSLKPITTSSTSLFQFGQTATTTTTNTTSSASTFQSPPTTSSASTNLFQPPANPSSASGFQLPSAPSTTTSRFQFGATATTTSSDQFGINTTTTTTSSIKYPPIISLPSTTSSTTNLFQTKTSSPQTQSTSFQSSSSATTTTTTTTTTTSPIFQFGQSSSTSFPIKPLATTTTTTTSATAFPMPTAGIQNSGTNLFAPATTVSSNPFQLQVTSSSTFGSNTFGTNSFQSPPTTTTTSSFGSNTTFSFGGGGGGGTATTGSSSSIAPFTFGGNTSVFPQQPASGFTNSFNGGEQFKFGNNSFQSNILQNNNPLANPTPAQPSIQPFGVKTQVQPQANLQFNLNPTNFNFASNTNSFGQNGQDSQLFQFSAAADPQLRGQNPSRIIKKARRRLQ